MIKYSQKDIVRGEILRHRFALIKLRDQCKEKSAYWFPQDIHNWIIWCDLEKDFEKLLEYYDNGIKLNEDFLIKLYNTKLDNIKNPIVVKRLIKLIKIN